MARLPDRTEEFSAKLKALLDEYCVTFEQIEPDDDFTGTLKLTNNFDITLWPTDMHSISYPPEPVEPYTPPPSPFDGNVVTDKFAVYVRYGIDHAKTRMVKVSMDALHSALYEVCGSINESMSEVVLMFAEHYNFSVVVDAKSAVFTNRSKR